jgi:hypothetical protein
MNLEDILNCLNDGYEFDSYQRTVVPAALAQDLILKAANLHKPKWINSEKRLPELNREGIFEQSENVLIYESGNFWVAYLTFRTYNEYRWILDAYHDIPIEKTYWMPLPKNLEN